MNWRLCWRAAPPFLLGLGLVGNLVRLEMAPARQWVPLTPPSVASEEAREGGEPPPVPSVEDRAVSLARPLFDVARHPPAASAAMEAPTPAQPVNNIALIGTIVSPEAQIALIKTASVPSVQRLRVGQSVGGWEIANIQKDRVTIRSSGVEQEITVISPAPPGAVGRGIVQWPMGQKNFRSR